MRSILLSVLALVSASAHANYEVCVSSEEAPGRIYRLNLPYTDGGFSGPGILSISRVDYSPELSLNWACENNSFCPAYERSGRPVSPREAVLGNELIERTIGGFPGPYHQTGTHRFQLNQSLLKLSDAQGRTELATEIIPMEDGPDRFVSVAPGNIFSGKAVRKIELHFCGED